MQHTTVCENVCGARWLSKRSSRFGHGKTEVVNCDQDKGGQAGLSRRANHFPKHPTLVEADRNVDNVETKVVEKNFSHNHKEIKSFLSFRSGLDTTGFVCVCGFRLLGERPHWNDERIRKVIAFDQGYGHSSEYLCDVKIDDFFSMKDQTTPSKEKLAHSQVGKEGKSN